MSKHVCPLCDEIYDDTDRERAQVHEHPEPQSGPYRDEWLKSGLPYAEWTMTEQGQKWLEHAAEKQGK